MKNIQKPPVITGYGSITALGGSSEQALANMSAGLVKNVLMDERFFPNGFAAPCFLVDSLQEGLARYGIEALTGKEHGVNRTMQLALVAIFEGLERAGLSLAELQKKELGSRLGQQLAVLFTMKTIIPAGAMVKSRGRSLFIPISAPILLKEYRQFLALPGHRLSSRMPVPQERMP